MKRAAKGVLLSGLVFPGLGQLALGRRKLGAALALTTLVCLAIMVALALRIAQESLSVIAAEGGVVDLPAITAAATRATRGIETTTFTLLVAVVAACWIAGIVDAWRCGRAKAPAGHARTGV